MGQGHIHPHEAPPPSTPGVRRRLGVALAPFIVATLVGLVLLWPGDAPKIPGPQIEQYKATVTRVTTGDCGDLPTAGGFSCSTVDAVLHEGPDTGDTITFESAEGPNARRIETGDRILLGRSPDSPPELEYYFLDYQRSSPLLLLAVIFAVVVVALSRFKGFAALGGLFISLLLLVHFVLPAILEGRSPLAVAIVGSAAIMFVTLYLAHGFNVRTTTAVLGTLVSLGLTGLLAYIFVEASRFTGFSSDEAVFLQISAQQVNLQGLLLGGIIIGTLGVLDDVTITQASAVWELRIANPRYSVKQLYTSALRIGRDHIASTVNTLVLAYAGAALPLLILFSLSNRPIGQVVTSEVVAEEIVRTLVGSIGLVASVPITTLLTAFVVTADPASVQRRAAASAQAEPEAHDDGPAPEAAPKEPKDGDDDAGWGDFDKFRSKAEREWRKEPPEG